MVMAIKTVGNDYTFLLEINLFDLPYEELDMSQYLTNRIHNCREIQVAGRHLMQHRGEQE